MTGSGCSCSGCSAWARKNSPDDGSNDTDELEKQSPSLQLRDMATPRMAPPAPPLRALGERRAAGLGVGLPPRRPVSLDRKTSEVGFGRGSICDEYAVKSKTPRAVKRVSLSTTTTTTTTYDVHINVDDVNDIESILVNIEAGRGRAKGVTPRGGGEEEEEEEEEERQHRHAHANRPQPGHARHATS